MRKEIKNILSKGVTAVINRTLISSANSSSSFYMNHKLSVLYFVNLSFQYQTLNDMCFDQLMIH